MLHSLHKFMELLCIWPRHSFLKFNKKFTRLFLGQFFFNKYGIFIIYYKLILLYFFNGAGQLNHTHDRCQS